MAERRGVMFSFLGISLEDLSLCRVHRSIRYQTFKFLKTYSTIHLSLFFEIFEYISFVITVIFAHFLNYLFELDFGAIISLNSDHPSRCWFWWMDGDSLGCFDWRASPALVSSQSGSLRASACSLSLMNFSQFTSTASSSYSENIHLNFILIHSLKLKRYFELKVSRDRQSAVLIGYRRSRDLLSIYFHGILRDAQGFLVDFD